MIKEFTTRDMSDLLYEDLSQIKDDGINITETSLQTLTTQCVFPCRLMNTPLDSVLKSENSIPVLKVFQLTIEHWCNSQRECMKMASNTDIVLQKRNIIRINTQPILYDEIT